MELLLLVWAIGWLVQNAAVEVKHATAGTTSPRSQMKLEKLRQQGKPGYLPQMGSREWVQALLADLVEAKIAKRRALAAKRERAAEVEEQRAHDDQALAIAAPTSVKAEPATSKQAPSEGPCCQCGQITPVREDDEYDPRRDVVTCAQCIKKRADANTTPTTTGPDAQIIPMFPNTKEAPDMSDVIETTGLQSAIAYAQGTARAHDAHSTAGNEAYLNSLSSKEFGVSGATLTAVAEAQEASGVAGELWKKAAAMLAKQHTVKEAYDQNPDAGTQLFVQSE